MTILSTERQTISTIQTALQNTPVVSRDLSQLIGKVNAQIKTVTENPFSSAPYSALKTSLKTLEGRVTREQSGRSRLARLIDAIMRFVFRYDRTTSGTASAEALSGALTEIDAANTAASQAARRLQGLRLALESARTKIRELKSEAAINAKYDAQKQKVEEESSRKKARIEGPITEYVPGNDSFTLEPVVKSTEEQHAEIDQDKESSLSDIEKSRSRTLERFRTLYERITTLQSQIEGSP